MSKKFLNITTSLAVALAVTASALAQQPLAAFVPAGSLLTVGAWQDAEPAPALRAELESLDWEGGLAVLLQYAEATRAYDTIGFVTGLLEESGGMFTEVCPQLGNLDLTDTYRSEGSTALFSLGFSPFNPEPAFTVVARLNAEQAGLAAEALPVLLACAADSGLAEVTELDQDGVPFWQVSIDYEAPFAFALNGDVFSASSSADQLRYSLRLQAGSDEPSLRDSALHDVWTSLNRGDSGLSWILDYGVVADLVDVFGPSLGSEELARDLAASFRTAGGTVGSVSASDSGIVWENQLTLNRDGGDTALFDLLLHTGLELPAAPVAIDGAVAVSSSLVNVQGFTDYIQSWLDRLSVMVGEDLDLRAQLASEGIDIDALLLGWLGHDMHSIQLESSSAGLASLVRGPAQVFAVAVSDEAAAERGVRELLDLAALIGELEGESFDIGVDIRAASWNGTPYQRIRVGPLTDLGVAVTDGYLLVGLPHTSLHAALDAMNTGRATRSAGSDRVMTTWLDAGAELSALADLADTLVQPVAFVLRTVGLEEASEPEDFWFPVAAQDWSDDFTYGTLDVSAQERTSLALGSAVSATIEPAADHYWQLEGLSAGQPFSVRMESDSLDPVLELYELETGRQVAYNDDYDWSAGRHAQIDYTAREGITYVVRANSWDSRGGDYTVSLFLEGSVADEVTETEDAAVPQFSELIDMLDLLPQALSITASRTFSLDGFMERRGDTLYSRYVLQTDW